MRFVSVLLGLLCLPLLAVVFFPTLFVPAMASASFVALLASSGRFYLMTETAWAQITAVGMSLQMGGIILGWAPESWWSNRGLERRTLWPSCLAIMLFAADYNDGARTAFGINVGSARIALKTKGRYSREGANGDLGWQFWRRTTRHA